MNDLKLKLNSENTMREDFEGESRYVIITIIGIICKGYCRNDHMEGYSLIMGQGDWGLA